MQRESEQEFRLGAIPMSIPARAGNAEMMFHVFDSLRSLGAAIKFIPCTVNLGSLSMEEVTNVHKIEVQVITSRPESVLTALPCSGVLGELLSL